MISLTFTALPIKIISFSYKMFVHIVVFDVLYQRNLLHYCEVKRVEFIIQNIFQSNSAICVIHLSEFPLGVK